MIDEIFEKICEDYDERTEDFELELEWEGQEYEVSGQVILTWIDKSFSTYFGKVETGNWGIKDIDIRKVVLLETDEDITDEFFERLKKEGKFEEFESKVVQELAYWDDYDIVD